MNKLLKWWKRRNFDLRQACIDKYSKEFGQEYAQEFGEMYDKTSRVERICGILET